MSLLARDVMQPHVIAVTPQTKLAELADLLIGKRIGGVPVVERGAVVGVVSRSDFARLLSLERSLAALVAEADFREEFAPGEAAESVAIPPKLLASIEERTVREIMEEAPITVSPETPICEVAEVLVTHHMHRVLVVEGTTARGVISSLDIVRLVSSRQLREP